MKKFMVVLFVFIVMCTNSTCFAKVYNDFEKCEKFRAGDVVRMENSPAFPSYIFELEVKEVIKNDGSIAIKGRHILTSKETGQVTISEDYTQIVQAKKMEMSVVVNINKPSTENQGSSVPQSGGNISTQKDEVERQPIQLEDKKANKDVLISPIRGISATTDKTQVWEVKKNNGWLIFFIIASIVLVALFIFIIIRNRHKLKKYARVTLAILLFLSAIDIPASYKAGDDFFSQNFDGVKSNFSKDYLTYGRTLERKKSAFQQYSGSFKSGWTSQVMHKTYSQPLVSGDYVYHYAGNTIYKINSSNGTKVGFLEVLENSSLGATIGNMTISGKYIFVGDRNLNIYIIDKDSMQQKYCYSLLTDGGFSKTLFNDINRQYGNKGIVSAPYVKQVNGRYEAYFGTSVGLFMRIVLNADGSAGTHVLNSKYVYRGSNEYSSYVNGSSICIVSSPVCVSDNESFNNCNYLYIGTPYSGSMDDFKNDRGYVCVYDVDDDENILNVQAVVEGGVETTMAYDEGKLVFADKDGNARFVSVQGYFKDRLELSDKCVELTYPSSGTSKPLITGSPTVFRFSSQKSIAVFSVSKEKIFKIVDSTATTPYVLNDEVRVSGSNDSDFGAITNSACILQMEERIYLLYADNNEICARDLTDCVYSGDISPAKIFKFNDIETSSISLGNGYITSDITVAGGKIIFSDSEGKLHCLGLELGDGDFILTGNDLELYRKVKNLDGTYGAPELMIDPENQPIEIGSNYVYQLKAKIDSSFVSNIDNVKITLSAYQIPENGIEEKYKFKITDAQGQSNLVTEVPYFRKIDGGIGGATTTFETDELQFGMDFRGRNVKFCIEVNPSTSPNRTSEPNYNNNKEELRWEVHKYDVNLYIYKEDVKPQKYIPLDFDGGPREPVLIRGIVFNSSVRIPVKDVPIVLTITDSEGNQIKKQTIMVDIKPRNPEYTGTVLDPEYSGMQYFVFQVEQDSFDKDKYYTIKVEVNPIIDGKRKIYEMNEQYYPPKPDWSKIFNDNVAELKDVKAVDRDSLDTYGDVWIDNGVIHEITGELADYAKYRRDMEFYQPLPSPMLIKTKSGYGIDLRSVFTLKYQGTVDGIDWDTMHPDLVQTECYIIRPDSYILGTELLGDAGKAGVVATPLEGLLTKQIKELPIGDIGRNCIQMIVKDEQTGYEDCVYVHKVKMESNIDMNSREDGLTAIADTQNATFTSVLGESGDLYKYVFALENSQYSPHKNRQIYTDKKTPDNQPDQAYTILICTTFKAQIQLSNGTYRTSRVRTTNLYSVLIIGGVMLNDDATQLLQ